MGMKDFDFKELMIRKGERIGVGIAAGVMALFLISGLTKVIGSGTASGTALAIKNLCSTANQKIANSQPPAQTENPADAFVRTALYNYRVDAGEFALKTPLFTPSSLEDSKRRN